MEDNGEPKEDAGWDVFDELDAMAAQNSRLLSFNETLMREIQQYTVWQHMKPEVTH